MLYSEWMFSLHGGLGTQSSSSGVKWRPFHGRKIGILTECKERLSELYAISKCRIDWQNNSRASQDSEYPIYYTYL